MRSRTWENFLTFVISPKAALFRGETFSGEPSAGRFVLTAFSLRWAGISSSPREQSCWKEITYSTTTWDVFQQGMTVSQPFHTFYVVNCCLSLTLCFLSITEIEGLECVLSIFFKIYFYKVKPYHLLFKVPLNFSSCFFVWTMSISQPRDMRDNKFTSIN